MSRILLTVHKFFPDHRAGTEVLTLKIAQELLSRNHEVLIVCADPPDTDARHSRGESHREYEYDGLRVHSIGEPLRLAGYTYRHEFLHPGIAAHFNSVLDEFKPDLVHVMHAQNLSASVVEESKKRGLRVILSPTDFWFICPIVQLKRTDGTICEGPGPEARHCMTCYTPELLPPKEQFLEALGNRFPVFDSLPIMRQLAGSRLVFNTYLETRKKPAAVQATRERPEVLREIGNRVDAITVPTRIMKELFVKNGFRDELIHHIPFGIDCSELKSHQNKTDSEFLRIGYIGTLFEHKGVDILIRAVQSIQSTACRLKIYGNPGQFEDYFAELEALVKSKPEVADRIEFLGTFPNRELGAVLEQIDVLVVPSRWYENTPLVMQSALATRTPLIATDLGGMSELIDHEKNGLLFGLNDHEDLAAQISKLIEDPAMLSRFIDNIAPQRTVPDMVDDLERLYFAEKT